ncbi:hypothetical protein LWE69_06090 [Paenibacillus sp. UKAQ_18]|nr:hypothetical protein [Paenibacillus sp. UKAQ_18]
MYETEGWEEEGYASEGSIDASFNRLVASFSQLKFLIVINSINSGVEAVELFSRTNDWTEISFHSYISFEHLFSAIIICLVEDEASLDRLMRTLPPSINNHFKMSKRTVYTPDLLENQEPKIVYDFVITIHPSYMTNKFLTRLKFTEYFDKLNEAIQRFLN